MLVPCRIGTGEPPHPRHVEPRLHVDQSRGIRLLVIRIALRADVGRSALVEQFSEGQVFLPGFHLPRRSGHDPRAPKMIDHCHVHAGRIDLRGLPRSQIQDVPLPGQRSALRDGDRHLSAVCPCTVIHHESVDLSARGSYHEAARAHGLPIQSDRIRPLNDPGKCRAAPLGNAARAGREAHDHGFLRHGDAHLGTGRASQVARRDRVGRIRQRRHGQRSGCPHPSDPIVDRYRGRIIGDAPAQRRTVPHIHARRTRTERNNRLLDHRHRCACGHRLARVQIVRCRQRISGACSGHDPHRAAGGHAASRQRHRHISHTVGDIPSQRGSISNADDRGIRIERRDRRHRRPRIHRHRGAGSSGDAHPVQAVRRRQRVGRRSTRTHPPTVRSDHASDPLIEGKGMHFPIYRKALPRFTSKSPKTERL